jgi:hypothetical protein
MNEGNNEVIGAFITVHHTTPFPTKKQTNKLRGLGPRANYTDRATSSSWRSSCQLLQKESVAWSEQRIPMVVISDF